MSPKGIVGPHPIVSLSLLPGHEMSGFALSHAPAMMGLATGPKQWGQLIMHWNLQNCEPKQNFFLYKLIISGISLSM
jgi:hypothetical protein